MKCIAANFSNRLFLTLTFLSMTGLLTGCPASSKTSDSSSRGLFGGVDPDPEESTTPGDGDTADNDDDAGGGGGGGGGGSGTVSVSVSVSDSATHDFGTKGIYTISEKTFTVTNDGTATIPLTGVDTASLALASPLSLSGGTCTTLSQIAAGESCTLIVRYRPTTAGAISQSIDLSWAGATASGTISGTAVRTARQLSSTGAGFTNDAPKYFTAVGSNIYYVGLVGTGSKVFRYTGSGPSVQISNINAGGDDDPASLTAFGSSLCFTAYNGTNGRKLYCYDEGTGAVSQISNTLIGGGDDPASLTVVGSNLYFLSHKTAGNASFCLFRFNGTSVTQIAAVNADENADYPSNLTALGTDLYYSAYYGMVGSKIFRHDGTSGAPVMIPEVNAGQDDAIGQIYAFNGRLYYPSIVGSDNELFSWGVGDVSPTRISNTNTSGADYPSDLVGIGTDLYFTSDQGSWQRKIFKYDTVGGTVTRQSNINNGASDNLTSLRAAGSDLYFIASDASYQPLVGRISSGVVTTMSPNSIVMLFASDGTHFYIVDSNGADLDGDGMSDSKLYQLNGLTKTLVANVNSSGSDNPLSVTAAGGALYFSAVSSTGRHAYSYSGTLVDASNTSALITPPSATGPDSIAAVVAGTSDVYFSAKVNNKSKLFRYNLLTDAVTQISDIRGSSADDYPSGLTLVGSNLYFIVQNGGPKSKETYRYDGSTLTAISEMSNIYTMTAYGSSVCYRRNRDSDGFSKVFCYDGITATQVSNTNPGGHDQPQYMAVSGSNLYFVANNSTGSKLFKWDGSTVTQASDTNSTGNDSPSELAASTSGGICFKANNSSGNSKLFCYSGSGAATTTAIADLNTGMSPDDDPRYIVQAGSYLYFVATPGMWVYHVYRYDGSTVTQVSDTTGMMAMSDDPRDLTFFNGSVCFSAYNATSQRKVYCHALTSSSMVSSPAFSLVGGSSDDPEKFRVVGSNLYFRAADGTGAGNSKMYVYDGTTATQLFSVSNWGSDAPDYLTSLGSLLFLKLNASGRTGDEAIDHLYMY